MSLFAVGADVTLQTRDHPLVHVVGHHAHHFHTSLDLHKHQQGKENGGRGEKKNLYQQSAPKPIITFHP